MCSASDTGLVLWRPAALLRTPRCRCVDQCAGGGGEEGRCTSRRRIRCTRLSLPSSPRHPHPLARALRAALDAVGVARRRQASLVPSSDGGHDAR